MSRAAQNFVLLLIGAAVLKISLDGTFLRYVKPGLQPYLIVSGSALLLLAVVAIVGDIRSEKSHEDDHHHPGRPQWLLLAPITALLIIVPPALGATSVESGATAQASIAEPAQAAASDNGKFPFAALPPGDAPLIRMYDLIDRASYDSSGELDRRSITVQGFVIRTDEDGSPRPDGSHDGLDLARVVITCCVADAQTLRIHLAGPMPALPDDSWVSVQGKVVPDSATQADNMTPTLSVT
ncbi:TIGR03943 family putative permease subunit, partial [Nocardia alni]|uniref:TIGR03943 family putative permease subunit n=1 Tax=Nocardia alni TaxID=2815723 RepID=UPI001C21FD57